jgi:gliding motility-associated-like protein
LGAKTQPDAKIYIFDRFGKLLAQIDPNGEGWDGRFNGFQMPSTDYWFSIELKDGTVKKGHFSLVRR